MFRSPHAVLVLLTLSLLLSACQSEFGPIEFAIRTSSVIDQPVDDPDYTETQHPIVLVHGLSGFDRIFGLDYFHHVPRALEVGGAKVFTPSLSAFNKSEFRGEQLITYLEDLQAIDPTMTKFNLIGHSHGAQTVRYVAALRPAMVASVSTVAGVNRLGSERGELVTESYQSLFGTAVVDVAFTLYALLIDTISDGGGGLPQFPRKAFEDISFKGTETFNAAFPEALPTVACDTATAATVVNGVRYYSWGGVGLRTNSLDPLDRILEVTRDRFPDDQNDGTLGRCATHLGDVINDAYSPMNHTDLTNQALGLIHPNAPNPLTLFRIHANRLKIAGL